MSFSQPGAFLKDDCTPVGLVWFGKTDPHRGLAAELEVLAAATTFFRRVGIGPEIVGFKVRASRSRVCVCRVLSCMLCVLCVWRVCAFSWA